METKKQISAKVRILTVIIMIVGTIYWFIGKCQVWLTTLTVHKSIDSVEKENQIGMNE